ncbi:MAG: 1-acyl-sn-glycerol-3-phosphate acyltransferase [Clostridium sp.]|nr:1-acyl-sn-glycerol-3-phosphate acyltransferase [Clostridium sp.]
MFIRFVKAVILVVFALLYRVKITGMENIPEEGAAVMCANHVGELDMLFIGCKIKRLIHYMAKIELFKIPLLSPIIKRLGAFPVKRGKADIEAIKTALSLLENGHIVGIFPEGTRVGNNTQKKARVKPGAALLAQKTGAPILPVAVEGKYTPFSKIRVIFGEPFTIDLDKNKKYTNSELVKVSENIMNKIYSLLEAK